MFGLVLDVDGVLQHGNQPIAAGQQALRRIMDDKMIYQVPCLFVTNGGGVTEKLKAESMSNILGLPISEDQVIVSHTPMKSLLPLYRDKHIVVLDSHEVKKVAISYGFEKVTTLPEFSRANPLLYTRAYSHQEAGDPPSEYVREPVHAVLVMSEPADWAEALQVVLDIVTSDGALNPVAKQQVKIYFSNPDFVYADKWREPRITMGAFRDCLRTLVRQQTGAELEYTQFGKPTDETYNYAKALLREMATARNLDYDKLEIFGIGDNPKSDIAGANRAGEQWSSVLVRTGVFRGADNDDEFPAKHVCDDVNVALDMILEKYPLNK
eukprot:GFYU01002111.1.p1 GENE.GFYU01002111.1~~GFYU01002111.1.p1  ORF type:complete len:324 (+),score=49.33 GFYU01002111.1:69-1040(+)